MTIDRKLTTFALIATALTIATTAEAQTRQSSPKRACTFDACMSRCVMGGPPRQSGLVSEPVSLRACVPALHKNQSMRPLAMSRRAHTVAFAAVAFAVSDAKAPMQRRLTA